MNVKIEKGNLKTILKLADSDLELNFKKDSAELKQINKEQTIFINAKLGKSFFKEYDIEENQDICFEVGIANSILTRFSNSATIQLDTTATEISLIGENKNYTFPLIEKSTDSMPSIDFEKFKEKSCLISIKAGTLKELLADAKISNEFVIFKTENNDLFAVAKSHKANFKKKVDYSKDLTTALGEIKSCFNIDFLEQIVRVLETETKVNLTLGLNKPMTISANQNGMTLNCVIAQRTIDENEKVEEQAKEDKEIEEEEESEEEGEEVAE